MSRYRGKRGALQTKGPSSSDTGEVELRKKILTGTDLIRRPGKRRGLKVSEKGIQKKTVGPWWLPHTWITERVLPFDRGETPKKARKKLCASVKRLQGKRRKKGRSRRDCRASLSKEPGRHAILGRKIEVNRGENLAWVRKKLYNSVSENMKPKR